MKLICWNVNGLRSVLRKRFLDFPARPRQNVGNYSFTLEERAGFAAFLAAGFVVTFRELEKGGGHYTCWIPGRGVRERNIGWRMDCFLISPVLRPRLKAAFIRAEVRGSDHCPVGIELD